MPCGKSMRALSEQEKRAVAALLSFYGGRSDKRIQGKGQSRKAREDTVEAHKQSK